MIDLNKQVSNRSSTTSRIILKSKIWAQKIVRCHKINLWRFVHTHGYIRHTSVCKPLPKTIMQMSSNNLRLGRSAALAQLDSKRVRADKVRGCFPIPLTWEWGLTLQCLPNLYHHLLSWLTKPHTVGANHLARTFRNMLQEPLVFSRWYYTTPS